MADLLTDMNEGQLFWLAGFLAGKCSGGSASATTNTAAATVGAEQAPASAFNRKNPYAAVILTNQLLSGRGSDKEVRHIELSLEDSGLSYNPGDALKALVADSSELKAWTEGRDLLDLVRAWPIATLAPQELVNLPRKLPPRLYSISSSQAFQNGSAVISSISRNGSSGVVMAC